MFRHGSVYVQTGSSLESLRELEGKRVGTGDYNVTAAVWMRGVMQHECGVDPGRVTWVVNKRTLHAEVNPPSGVPVEEVEGSTPEDLLLAEEVDAIILPYRPKSLGSRVRRLLRDHRAEEVAYFRKTGIFPIMHVVGLRRSLYESMPWIANSLMFAFEESKRKGRERMEDTAGLAVGLAWLGDELERQEELLGEDPFSYGFAKNEMTLQVLCDYVWKQGLSRRAVHASELFAPETLTIDPAEELRLF
jgi:4,5-dihydroxyphthalate decarboxylase